MVTDQDGKRRSLDVRATSLFEAGHPTPPRLIHACALDACPGNHLSRKYQAGTSIEEDGFAGRIPHTYVIASKLNQRGKVPDPLPVPTIASVFEVVIDGKVHRVEGKSLRRWIARQRGELKGPSGQLFRQRPGLD